MRTSQQMIAKYNARYNPIVSGTVREAVAVQAKANFAAYANAWEVYAGLLRDVISAAGVSTVDAFGYWSFGNRMFHIVSHSAGASAAMEAALILAQYVALGLDTGTLEAIRTQVFNVNAPVGP